MLHEVGIPTGQSVLPQTGSRGTSSLPCPPLLAWFEDRSSGGVQNIYSFNLGDGVLFLLRHAPEPLLCCPDPARTGMA